MILIIDPYSKDGSMKIVRAIQEVAETHVFWGEWNSPFFMDIPPDMDVNPICDLLRENCISYEARIGREYRKNDFQGNNEFIKYPPGKSLELVNLNKV